MENTSTVRTKKKRSPAIRAALVSLLIMMTLVVTLAMFILLQIDLSREGLILFFLNRIGSRLTL